MKSTGLNARRCDQAVTSRNESSWKIATELGVGAILEGAKAGNQVQITTQLMETKQVGQRE